ncbi:MAG: prepilin peptidase [Patescibacteria group bacterium]|nr:prepilin peptidase [Patescibacteria group bacterium]
MNPISQLFVFFFGAVIGSFVNAVAWRLRTGENFLFSRSHCPACRHDLEPVDLVPVASWILLGGKCRHCHRPISPQYLLVEVAMGSLFLLAAIGLPIAAEPAGWLPLLLFRWYCLAVLVLVFIYDYKYLMILRSVTLPATAVAFLANLALGMSWWRLIIGMAIAGGFFWLQYVVSRGRWIGGGDAYLGLLIGAILGWPQILVALFLSYVTGAACGVVLLLTRRKNMRSQLPFGTFLAIGTAAALIFGERLLTWYLGLSV